MANINKITLPDGTEYDIEDATARSDLPNKADKADTVLDTTLSRGRKANTTVGTGSIAFGNNVTASGNYSCAEGEGTKASGNYSYAEGYYTTASNSYAHAEGSYTNATGSSSHAEGYNTYSSGNYSHTEGYGNSSYGAKGKADHAEGYQTTANSGSNSSYYGAHSEGYRSSASGNAAHAEGYTTTSSAIGAHAEGYYASATGSYAHAEGNHASASGTASHAEGYYASATGAYAHAEGDYTTASGTCSHAEGYYTVAGIGTSFVGQHVSGSYNNVKNSQTITVNDVNASEWQPYVPVPAYSTFFKVTENGTTTYYIPHADVPAYIDPRLDYTSSFWNKLTNYTGEASEWDKDSLYPINSVVKCTYADGTVEYYTNYKEITTTYYPLTGSMYHTQPANSTFNSYPNVLEIVGNGISGTWSKKTLSNARLLDGFGNERISGDMYVGCEFDSSGGKKVATESFVTGKIGSANGIAGLDSNGKVPTSQLPDNISSGSGSGLALGETDSTAYRGDRGKTAYDHATDSDRLTTAQTEGLYKIAVSDEGHVKSVTAVQKSDITALGIKETQTAVSDPSASGTSLTFIDSVSQDAQGVITPTKKTVKTMVGATAANSGAAGLVPQPTRDDNKKFLRGNGTWDRANRDFNLTYPGNNGYTVIAQINAVDDLGDITFKMGHNMTGTIPSSNVLQLESSVDDDMVNTTPLSNASVTATEVANRVYPISYDSNGKLCCMVPWESTTTGQCFTDIAFSLATSDWTLSNGVYTATITNALITSGSGIQAFYDSTLRTALTGDVYIEKGTGSATFTTTSQPVGTFTGVIRVLDSVSGVIPVGRGGTGGTTTKTSRAALNVPIRDIPVDFGTVSSLPQTVNDADLTANMVAFDCVFGNPAAIPGGIDVTFADGSVTITGTLATGASTSIKFWAHEVRGSVEGTETAQEVAHVSEYVQINPQTLTDVQKATARTNIGVNNFVNWDYPNVSATLTNVDLNTVKTSGVYKLSGCTNDPLGSTYGGVGIMTVYATDTDTVRQTWYRHGGTADIYTRVYYHESWIGWERLAYASEVTSLSNNYTTLNTTVSNIGTYKTGTNASTLSVASATDLAASTVSLDPGTWVITAGFQWSASFEQLSIGSLKVGNSTITGTLVRHTGASGGGCNIATVYKNTGSSAATITLTASQYSGSSKTASNVQLRAVRII